MTTQNLLKLQENVWCRCRRGLKEKNKTGEQRAAAFSRWCWQQSQREEELGTQQSNVVLRQSQEKILTSRESLTVASHCHIVEEREKPGFIWSLISKWVAGVFAPRQQGKSMWLQEGDRQRTSWGNTEAKREQTGNKQNTRRRAKTGKTAENSGDEEEAQADHDGDVFLLIGSDWEPKGTLW